MKKVSKMLKNIMKESIERIRAFFLRKIESIDIYYIIESANWAVSEVAKDILPHIKNYKIKCVTRTDFINKRAIIHYGSLNTFLGDKNIEKCKDNKIIVTCFHIVDSDPRKYTIADKDRYVYKWHTSCNITKNKLIELGIDERKIVVIPISVNIDNYKIIKKIQKDEQKRKFEIDDKKIVIGYFQKDGDGWGEGDTPKLIKGPDIFCDALEKISRKYNVLVILSGPARGYVKRRLNEANIPFKHFVFDEAKEVAILYQLIDIYMVTSREEGGPRAILESMASGVPIISTNVGQAPDIIENMKNGIIVPIEDTDAIVKSFELIIENVELKNKMIQAGIETAKKFSSAVVAMQYENMLYR